jgi:hypothetical protein
MSAVARSPWPPVAGISPRSNCSPAVARPLSWTRLTRRCSQLRAVSRSACRKRLRRRWATRRWVRLDPRPVRPPWPHGGGACAARQRPTRGHPRLEQLHPPRPGRHARPHTDRAAPHRPGRRPADCAFDRDGPTPLDCAIWGIRNNRAEDGDYPGTVRALLAAGAPTRHQPPTGDSAVDALLINGHR